MTIGSAIWPRSRPNYSQRAALGRFLHVAFVILGGFPLGAELMLRPYLPHIEIYGAFFLVSAIIGRVLRYWLAQE